MGTTTHYVVRNAEGEHLAGWWCGSERRFVFDTPRHEEDEEFASRTEAERLAAEHGGTVVEIETIERVRGLRWVRDVKYPRWHLFDGDPLARGRLHATVEHWPKEGVRARRVLPDGDWAPLGRTFDTLDEAKAAAEAAVEAGWT